MVQQAARDYAVRRVGPQAAELDRDARFPVELVRGLAELGLLGVNIEEKWGGADAGVVAYALAMMEISRACASTAVSMAVTNMVAEVIQEFGSEAQRRGHIPKITSGEHITGSFALSEPGAGSDAAQMRTTAKRAAGGWVIDGQKAWITSGTHSGVFVVWARTGGPGAKGISCFLVDKGADGMSIGKPESKHGLRASTTVPLGFDECFVPDDALLGDEGGGFKIAMMALDGGRVGIGSQAVGIASAALDEAVAYSKEREAFGNPIAQHQAIQWMIADSGVELAAARSLVLRAAWLKEQKHLFSQEASMAKLFASEAANRICNRAVQIHGGYGYIREFAAERHLRDVRVTTIYEGTSEVQRIVIARNLLG